MGGAPDGQTEVMSRSTALAVLLLAVASGCSGTPLGDDDPRSAYAGEVFTGGLTNAIQGHHSYVVIPGLRYDFTVSEPTGRMDSIAADEGGVDDEAGEDVRFVGVSWELEAQLGDAFVMEAAEEPRTLSLLVDGEPTVIGDLDEEGLFGAYVAVPADADDIGLSLEYDGLTQTVEDAYDPVTNRPAEPAALYLDVPSVEWRYCPRTRLPTGDRRLTFFGTDCSANVSSALPYYGPLGWAPAGKSWVVAEVRADSTLVGLDLGDDYVDYEATSEVRLRLGELSPVELLPAGDDVDGVGMQDDGSFAAVAVFQVGDGDGGPLRFVRSYVATPEEDDPPAGAPDEFRVTQRVELP